MGKGKKGPSVSSFFAFKISFLQRENKVSKNSALYYEKEYYTKRYYDY
jgi:hypothetical protein